MSPPAIYVSCFIAFLLYNASDASISMAALLAFHLVQLFQLYYHLDIILMGI